MQCYECKHFKRFISGPRGKIRGRCSLQNIIRDKAIRNGRQKVCKRYFELVKEGDHVMTLTDIDRIAQEYFDDKESTHEMDEVFEFAKKGILLAQVISGIKEKSNGSHDPIIIQTYKACLLTIDKIMKEAKNETL